MKVLFFRIQEGVDRLAPHTLPMAFHGGLEIWSPSASKLKPEGLGWFPFGVWWLCHYLHIFRNRTYKIYLVRVDDKIVHRSCLFPSFLRFPFMRFDDLQVGDIWTMESERRQGLSLTVLIQILNDYPNRTIWFLCEAMNTASVRLAKSAGMELYAVGTRASKFGFGVFGQFVVTQKMPIPSRLRSPNSTLGT